MQATILGGSPSTNYTYQWDNWAQSNTIGGLVPGAYEVSVTDPTGCEVVASFNLTSSPPIEFLPQATNPACDGVANGNIQLDLTGAAPFTYQWSNGSTDPTIANLGAGNYSVVVTDANGCTRLIEVALENEEMEVSLTLDDPTCASTADGSIVAQVTTGGTAPYTYQWSNGGTEAQLSDLAAGTYSLSVKSAEGCVSVQSLVVEPAVEIQVAFAWASLGCDDSGVVVDLSGQSANAVGWAWTLSNGQTYQGQNPQLVFDQSPMEVTLTVTSAEGCEASASQMVEAAPISLVLQGQSVVCESAATSFDLQVNNPGGGVLTYDWQPANLVVSGQGTANPVFAIADAGDYTVTVSVSDGTCTVDAEAVLSVTEVLTIDPAAVSSSQCEDLAVDFINTSGLSGTWYFEYPNTAILSTEQNPSYTYATAGNYQVAFVPDGGCAETLALQVSVADAPQIAFAMAADDCNEPITVVFTNTSNVTVNNFLWDFGPLGTSTEANPELTISGSQTVTATLTASFGNGCEQSVVDEISVESFVPPTLADLQHVCVSGETSELNTGGDPAYQYVWTGGNIGTCTEVNPTVTVVGTTVFNVVITAANGCTATGQVTVEVPAEPFALLPLADIVGCEPGPITISAQTNAPGGTWVWATDSDLNNTVGEEQTITVDANNQPITYYVLATDPHGCTDMASFSVSNAAIEIVFDGAFEVCKGDMLVFNVTLVNADVADITNWQPFNPLENPVFANEDFTFDVTNDQGCMGHGEMTVKVVEFSDPLAIGASPKETWTGQSSQLSVTEGAGWLYAWTPAETLDDPASPTPVASPVDGSTVYQVVVTETATGCRQLLEIEVKAKDIICDEPYIFVPTAFTPNGDGTNDVLKVEGFNVETMYFTIYDRWGEMVFQTYNLDQGWDGSFRGAVVSGDVYGYFLKARCPSGLEYFKKGNITVLR